ncbi:MAG: PD-(D/E)XK motif protein [Ignavibacteria bacterium]|nr:PD-(D/E)XK motif protein [Ignavibacteria bacterium]
MKIKQIWDDLANDKSLTSGLLFRRYSGAVKPDVYVALQHPEKFLCIYVAISKTSEVNISNFSNLQEIQVDLFASPNEADKNILIFKLLNFEHKDIFSVLCEDLFASISEETNEKKIIREVLNRFEKWKSLFSKIGMQGLKPEEQRGLFGELYFLRKFLKLNSDFLAVINTWTGTEKQIRDFQSGSWAVEVKTTHGNNHQKVRISSERQLDITNLDDLFLYHISLEQQQNSGETLNDIVDSVIDILRTEIIALNKFKSKVYEVGYFDLQRNLYESIGYHIRQDVFYKVEKDFPRIEENDLRVGVGDVKYSIILSPCESFSISESEVFDTVIP